MLTHWHFKLKVYVYLVYDANISDYIQLILFSQIITFVDPVSVVSGVCILVDTL
jgi:hypothetical protein